MNSKQAGQTSTNYRIAVVSIMLAGGFFVCVFIVEGWGDSFI